LIELYKGPLVVQQYIPDIEKHEKRIILIDGEIIGSYLRIGSNGELPHGRSFKDWAAHRPNHHDRLIADTVADRLKEMGIFLSIIDVIGDYLIEINITSPGGLVSFGKVQEISAEKIFWDKMDEKIKRQ
jgi:glutathione synthase